ncbi:hypothetical protein TIFTF001_004489 [Ficus carica]|uniref:phosphopyruvate hydratase n=1 Tax=Ficus carica TaxID=3494 RepID=A0AA87ZVD9_FICCA|nr:hypothetical protein TIFTF001_004489 [Ficus carica]
MERVESREFSNKLTNLKIETRKKAIRRVEEGRSNPTIQVAVSLCDTTALLPGGITNEVADYVKNVISSVLIGKDPTEQAAIDKILAQLVGKHFGELKDAYGSKDSRPFLNVIWTVSVAVCKAGAEVKGISLYKHIAKLACIIDPEFITNCELPIPIFNITDGGSPPRNKLAHFVIIPKQDKSFYEANEINQDLCCNLLKYYDKNAIDEGDEGDYTPCIQSAIDKQDGSALLFELNRVRSVTECIEIVSTCKQGDWKLVMSSHVGCNMKDKFIADLSVGLEMLSKIERELTDEQSKLIPSFVNAQYNIVCSSERAGSEFAQKIRSGENTRQTLVERYKERVYEKIGGRSYTKERLLF